MPWRGLAVNEWWFWAGVAAALLCFAQLLYPLRRPLMARPFGTARRALQFHIYGSSVMFVLVLVHAGIAWPAGWLGRALLVVTAWTVASGLAGVWIQRRVPGRLLEHGGSGAGRTGSERLLHNWLVLHVPAAVALPGLLVWHIFAVVYF
jgi:hypothetical protein